MNMAGHVEDHYHCEGCGKAFTYGNATEPVTARRDPRTWRLGHWHLRCRTERDEWREHMKTQEMREHWVRITDNDGESRFLKLNKMTPSEVTAALWALGVNEPCACYEDSGLIVKASTRRNVAGRELYWAATIELKHRGAPSLAEMQEFASALIELSSGEQGAS